MLEDRTGQLELKVRMWILWAATSLEGVEQCQILKSKVSPVEILDLSLGNVETSKGFKPNSDISRMLRIRCLRDFLRGPLGRHSKQKG